MKKNNDIIDLVKFILAIIVVMIHINPFYKNKFIIYPICRIAVPIFFMISSYFFFKNKTDLKKFVTRNLKLYLFYFVLLFPIIFIEYKKYSGNFGIYIIKNFFLGSTFPASWYIMALIIGITIIYIVSNKLNINNYITLIISFIIYIICCLNSNYANLEILNIHFFKSYNSFLVSFIWIVIGKSFAENENKLCTQNMRIIAVKLLISLVLLYIESFYINKFKLCSNSNDCYIFLIPVSLYIFKIILKLNYSLKNAKFYRTFSTITYCLHISIGKILYIFMKNTTIEFFLVIIICYIITKIIISLENQKYFKWLKYSH